MKSIPIKRTVPTKVITTMLPKTPPKNYKNYARTLCASFNYLHDLNVSKAPTDNSRFVPQLEVTAIDKELNFDVVY